MDVNLLTVNKSKAQEEYKAYRELVKNNRTDVDYAKDMKRLYNTIKSGRKIIDIYEAFKTTGLNEKEEPKLAIARADCKMVTFEKQTGGGGLFYSDLSLTLLTLFPAKSQFYLSSQPDLRYKKNLGVQCKRFSYDRRLRISG